MTERSLLIKLKGIQYIFSLLLAVFFLFQSDPLVAQNTPLGTPATQNADGTTDVPGTPAACASGFGIYSIDHEDENIGFLPGGFCVTTELENSGTTSITVTGTPSGAGIGDVDNIVVDGGRINYSSTDGGNLDATYNFCETVTNPYVFIGDLETFTTINFSDCAGNPINVNLMNGQSRFAVSGNSALITGTTSTNQDGYVQVPGSYDCLVINIDNVAPFTLDVIQISVGVCMPTPPDGNMVCPYDLYMWKKDEFCTPVYRDADGTFYEKDQNNNNIASLGDELFTNNPICGTLELLETNAIDDNACEPDFTCDAFPVEIEYYEPAGTGCLYSTYWYDQTSFDINDSDPGNQWSAIFSNTDAFGLPAHPGTPTNAAENCGLEWLGDNEGDIDFDDEAGGANEDEQLQLDGWLYVANHLECIQFRIGSSATDHSVALYLGADLNSMTLVTEENDEQAGAGNNATGVVGSFCIPDNAATTIDDCAWKVIRVRIYAHDDDTAYDPAVDWSFNGGLTWDVVEEQWFVAATSASDNTPPVGAGTGGCNPITHCLIDSDEVLVDEEGNVWPAGNCTSAPNNLYEPNLPNGGTCFGDANAEEGDHFSLMPYCIRYNDEPSFTCNICEIDIQVAGCACNNPDNVFADACPQSVTEYQQTLTINSETNNSYTITGVGIVGGITTVDGVGEEQTFTFFVMPGTAYTITVVGDNTGIEKTFQGMCEAPNDCNCPSAPEVCGDGLDNDCDGLVDGADPDIAGDCQLACTPDPVIIDGKELCLDGYLTHQIWSRECGNTGCCPSSINPHSCALVAFPCVDINGLPAHFNQCNTIPVDPCNPPGPAGQAGCTGNDVFTLLGSTHNQATQFYSTRPEQTQLDGWLVVPPGLTCFELKVNNPRAWDAQAVYMGAGVASMSLIGATSFPPLYNTDNEASCQADDGSNGQNSDVFNYDVTTDGATPVTVDGCTWHVVRVRAYIFDESWYHNTPVQWNFGDGFQTIPRKYFQSVGPDGWDTDNNKPTAANVIDAAPFCAYQDADGDLFNAQGDLIALDRLSCQEIGTSTCLDCPPFYVEALCSDNVCSNIPDTDDNGDLVPVELECDLFLYEVTPQVIDAQTSPGSGLLTRYWDHDMANCTSDQLENESIFCAFNATNGASGTCTTNSTGDDNCPTCLPSHPNFDNPTEADIITPTLGNTIHNQVDNDVDADDFVLGALNRTSGENVQQDGWLLVPPGVDCIAFRIYSLSWASGALYLGNSINDMTFVGEWINRNGNNTEDIFYFDVPANAQTVNCAGCDNQDFRMLRVRTYTHDNNMFANTIWDWNVNGIWEQVPTSHLFPVPDHCSDALPADICPTYTAGSTFVAIHEDSNGNGVVDNEDQWFNSPWGTCTAATGAFDINNPPSLVPISISSCDQITSLDCPLCCVLDVTCPPTDLGTISCNDAIPAAATDEASFEALGGNIADNPGPCGNLVITAVDVFDPPTDICNGRTMTRTYTIADDNSSFECTQTLMITPPAGPTIVCPADQTVSCFADILVSADNATVTTDCSLGTTTTVSDPVQVGPDDCPGTTYAYTYTTTDDCGRTASCTQTFTIDNAGPIIECIANGTVECEDDIQVSEADVTVTSACNLGFNINISGPVVYGQAGCVTALYEYTYTVIDACGRMASCTRFITIDNDPPTISCPAGQTVECSDDIMVNVNNATVTTSCDYGFNLTLSGPVINGAADCPGTTYTYTYRVQDECGRAATCEQIFTIGNNAGPTITCPANQTIECLAQVNVNPAYAVVTTSCGQDYDVMVSEPEINGAIDCPGTTYSYKYTVIDACGRTASCERVFTVANDGPILDCPDNALFLNCEDYSAGGIEAKINAWITTVTATSSCGIPTQVTNNFNINSLGMCLNNPFTDVTFFATDNCGRTATCTGTIIMVDTEAPAIKEEAQDMMANCGENLDAVFQNWLNNQAGAIAIDACSDISWSTIPANPTISCNGMNNSVTVTFVATDACGNSAATTATFSVMMIGGPGGGNDITGEEDEKKDPSSLINGGHMNQPGNGIDRDRMALFQNRPNPFNNETVISFYLPEGEVATLRIFDVTGKLVYQSSERYGSGYQEVVLTRADLSGTGVFYYQLQSGSDALTMKLILTN